MATPYIPLNDEDKLFHVTSMVDDHYDPPITVSGILASGEANYYDEQQNPSTRTFIGNNYAHNVYMGAYPLNSPLSPSYDDSSLSSILSPSNLAFNDYLSNSLVTTRYEVYDFSQFEPYIHYMPKPYCDVYVLDPLGCAIRINPSLFLNLAVFAYNTGS